MSEEIAIVNPPIYQHFLVPPLGLAYINALLKKENLPVKVYNLDIKLYAEKSLHNYICRDFMEDLYERGMFKKIEQLCTAFEEMEEDEKKVMETLFLWMRKNYPKIFEHRYFLITTNERNLPFALFIAKKAKEENPDSVIILGGPETSEKRDFLIGLEFIDFLVLGESDTAINDLIRELKTSGDLNKVESVVYKKEGKIKINPPSAFLNLDKLPFPDFEGFSVQDYPHKFIPIRYSSGCPYKCTFCCVSFYAGRYKARNPEKLVEEIKLHKQKYRTDKFMFCDSIINLDIGSFELLCDTLSEANLNARFISHAKPKFLDSALLEKAARAGFKTFLWGVESGSQKVINHMNKGFSLEEASGILRNANKNGIRNHCFFIVGYPTETRKDFLYTLKFVLNNKEAINSANVTTFRKLKFANFDFLSENFSEECSQKELRTRKAVLYKKMNNMGVPNLLENLNEIKNFERLFENIF